LLLHESRESSRGHRRGMVCREMFGEEEAMQWCAFR
jgi:hypothetical protein